MNSDFHRLGGCKMDSNEKGKFRSAIYLKKPTPYKQLRKLEKELANSKIKNVLLLRLWMKRRGFYDLDENYMIQLVKLALITLGKSDIASSISLNRLIGDPEYSEFQRC